MWRRLIKSQNAKKPTSILVFAPEMEEGEMRAALSGTPFRREYTWKRNDWLGLL